MVMWLFGVAAAQDVAGDPLPEAMDIGRPLVVHIPLVEADAGIDLEVLVGSSDFGEMATLELYYRDIGDQAWSSLAFARKDNGDWMARVPGREISAPGLEYYIASTEGLSKGDRFASAASPQAVAVGEESGQTRARRELERFDGRTSRVRIAYEYASFGNQASAPAPDSWQRVEADFTYRVLRGVRQIRVGGSWLRGDSWEMRQGEATAAPDVGVDYGFAEVEIAPIEWFGLSGQLQLGAATSGFVVGTEWTLRLGFDPGTHVLIQAGTMEEVGSRAQLTLAWATVPRLPMHAALEITTWPTDGVPAVRGWYGLAVPVGRHADFEVLAGYESRSAALGGPLLGAGFSWSY